METPEEACPATAQMIELELEERTGHELTACYRALCASILLRTAMVIGKKVPPRKQEIEQQATAKQWLTRKQGVVSFDSVCDTLGLDRQATIEALHRYANPPPGGPITKRKKPSCHYVFGRIKYAGPDAVGEGQVAGRVGPRSVPPVGNRQRQAGQGSGSGSCPAA